MATIDAVVLCLKLCEVKTDIWFREHPGWGICEDGLERVRYEVFVDS